MELLELEVFSSATNQAVVRPPGRRFPGVVIQGDSLNTLVRSALRVLARLSEMGADDDALGDAETLVSGLGGRLIHYQEVLAEHEIPLPYAEPLAGTELPRYDSDSDD